MKQAHRFSGPGGTYEGLTKLTHGGPVWTGKVRLMPEMLQLPLKWRKPRRVFVNSMSDLFHEDVPLAFIDEVFATMAITGGHTYQVLTKRPARMLAYMTQDEIGRVGYVEGRVKRWYREHGKVVPTGVTLRWPLPNVWLGVSVEDQATADERIPLLLQTPAAVRFVSAEPLIEPVEVGWAMVSTDGFVCPRRSDGPAHVDSGAVGIDWVIVGGESGPGARPCNVEWIRSIVEQCKAAETACFVKQLGARPYEEGCEVGHVWLGRNPSSLIKVHDRKGSDPEEWPEDLRVRELPRLRYNT